MSYDETDSPARVAKPIWGNETVDSMVDTIEELLEACRGLLHFMFQMVEDDVYDLSGDWLPEHPSVKAAQVAIANATGEDT